MVASWGFGSPDPPLWSGSDSATTSASFSFIISPSPPALSPSSSSPPPPLPRPRRRPRPRPPPLGSPGGSSAASAGAVFDDGDMNGLAVRITLATLEPLRITFATKPPTRRSITTAGDSCECVSGSHWESSGSNWLSCDCVPSTSQPRPGVRGPGARRFFSRAAACSRRRLLLLPRVSRPRCASSSPLSSSSPPGSSDPRVRPRRRPVCSSPSPPRATRPPRTPAPRTAAGASRASRLRGVSRERAARHEHAAVDQEMRHQRIADAFVERSPRARAEQRFCGGGRRDDLEVGAARDKLAPPGVPRSGAGGSRRDGARLRRTP